ncbi:uncharacterized protein LY89DRAFT_709804 [Mollisia scopiformis]|uniref:2'-phosphotransferase n=1 Tax=Mollisia scopiformis TaxID=149040 RepID=A0A194WV71_MOLSC|nr:uncharacterized protein LY89DRAFT_709804 [Mollisia scopiformis]KUJ11866.1 hypothetical protein LY89DRAFT_709804 [Mollisia scopiformis]
MAAAVLQPLQGLSLDGGIMDPSPISPNASRHGRGKHGGSVAKKTRGRGYSVVDERDVLISKALSFVLKRTVDENEEQEEGAEKLVADSEGWVDCDDILAAPQISSLKITFLELQALISSPTSNKSRFAIRLDPSTENSSDEDLDASDYQIRLSPSLQTPATPTTTSAILTPLTIDSEDLPDLIVYETSYANYPLILASGGIKRAGGQANLSFSALSSEGEMTPSSSADVSIYIPLRSAMAADPAITWSRTEAGNVVTEGDKTGVVSKQFWKKVVARRADIGVLFEDGVVRKEVPVGLRGKGVKGKKGMGKGGKGIGRVIKEVKAGSDEESSE